METPAIKSKVQQVNDILHKGEPGNISVEV
jgi:hypothetical protein